MCIIGKLINIRNHPTRDDLRIGEILDKQVVIGNHYEEGNLGFFIPAGAIVPKEVLIPMWNTEKDRGRLGGKKGNQVKLRQMDGVTSQGLFFGAYYFTKEGERIEVPMWNPLWEIGQDVSKEIGVVL